MPSSSRACVRACVCAHFVTGVGGSVSGREDAEPAKVPRILVLLLRRRLGPHPDAALLDLHRVTRDRIERRQGGGAPRLYVKLAPVPRALDLALVELSLRQWPVIVRA